MSGRGVVKLSRRVASKDSSEVWALTVPANIMKMIPPDRRTSLFFVVEMTDEGILFRHVADAREPLTAAPRWLDGTEPR